MKRLITSFFVAIFISLVMLSVLNDFGITWDEPVYMRSADQYVAWLKRPIFSDKDNFFRASGEDVHPPFRKIIGGITHEILTNRLHIIDNTRGYRVSSLLFVFPFIFLFAYVAIGQFGYTVGILVPIMFSLLPHVLFLTPLFTLDYAIAALWFVAVVTGIKGMKHYGWLTISGICVGLTLLTKLSGYLLFIPVVGFGLWYAFRQKTLWPSIIKILYLTFFAFAVYVIGWPWLWTSLLSHLAEYFRLQTASRVVPEYIFGRSYTAAPWWYTVVMFFTTTPAFVLVFFAIGSYWSVRKGKIWDRVMVLNALYPLFFFSLPGVYRYDWVRLFLPAYPFVALVAGRGIMQLKKSFRIFIILAWLATIYFSVIRIHPWESAYYNEFVGGISGAHSMGMESEFWGNSYLGVLPWMNANKKHMMCVTPTTYPFYYYQAMGQIEPGVTFTAGRGACDYVIVLMRQGLFILDPFIAKIVRTQKAIYTVSVDVVPLVSVYDIRAIKN